jgi:hypothetical protein
MSLRPIVLFVLLDTEVRSKVLQIYERGIELPSI